MEEGTFYSIVPNKKEIHPSLLSYCACPEITRASFDKDSERHVYVTSDGSERACKGLRSYIWTRFIPRDYVRPTRRRSAKIKYSKKSTTAEIGCRVSKFIEVYVERNGAKPLPLRRNATKIGKRVYGFSLAIIDWLHKQGYEVQAAELPVVFDKIGRMTRADLITKDRSGEHLVVWEIKCGWPSCAQRHGKRMKPPLQSVSCATFNQWFIQSVYTNAGLLKRGLDSVCVKVLHCWEEEIEFSGNSPKKHKGANKKSTQIVYNVAARPMPEWAIQLQKNIIDKI